jgi:hypothetical protein
VLFFKEGVSLTVIAEFVFVQYTALTLVGYICDPYASDGETVLFASLEEFVPERLV